MEVGTRRDGFRHDDGWTVTISNPTAAEMDIVAYAACV